MRNSKLFTILLILGVSVLLLSAPVFADVISRSESFDSSPSNWVGVENQNGTLGTSYGFSNTNYAGGAAGEAGGWVPERLNGVISYYADTDFDAALSQKGTVLSASGRITINNAFTDGGLKIGWLDTTTAAGYQDVLGLGIAGGPTGNRVGGQAVFTGYTGYWGPDGNAWGILTTGNDYLFDMTYDPTGVDATHGKLTVELRNASDNSPVATTTTSGILSGAGDHTMTLDGFGIAANYSTSNPGGSYEVYVDNLTYTATGVIPEPSSLALLAAGLLGLLAYAWRKRK